MTKFLRRNWSIYSKLGRKRRKKQVWKRPGGRDNKMREKRKGYPAIVGIGYKKNKKLANKIEGKTPVVINNINDLKKINDEKIALIGKVGKKKEIEILKKAKEMKIGIYRRNIEKFLKKINLGKKNKSEKVAEK